MMGGGWQGINEGRIRGQNFIFDIIIKKVQMIQEKARREVCSSKIFTYSVHPSYKSDTLLKIVRKPLKPETNNPPPPKQDNPYVFKPKSYSTRRNVPQNPSTRQLPRVAPSKRVKREFSAKKQTIKSYNYDLPTILDQTRKNAQEFLGHQFRPSLKKGQQNFKYRFSTGEQEKQKNENPMLENEIDIISNQNKKISVPIHDGLLKANTNHEKLEKDEHFLSKVVNPFNFQRKNHYLQNISFVKDYKSGYAPIDMQLRNSDEADETYIGSTKPHFIRKKQSTLSLPRSCGVSYIKPSESTQGEPYDPLPPLIFQCSSNCKDVKAKYEEEVKNFIDVSENSWICFIKTDQQNMRELLLGKKVGQVGWVNGIKNLWPLFAESIFILLMYSENQPSSESQVWEIYGNSLFKVGIMTKKSTSGKKSFFKSIGIEEKTSLKEKKSMTEEKNLETLENSKRDDEQKQQKEVSNTPDSEEKKVTPAEEEIVQELKDNRNVITLSLRMQMYVEEKQWKECSGEEKDLLCCLITCLKEHLEKQSLQIIKQRISLSKSSEKEEYLKNMLLYLRNGGEESMEEEHDQKLQESKRKISTENVKQLIKAIKSQGNDFQNSTSNFTFAQIMKINKNEACWEKTLKMPLYYISTRDSFAFDLVEKVTILDRNGHQYKKIEYFFEPDNLPGNYGNDYKNRFPNFDVGITCYHNFFTDEELKHFEKKTFETEENAFKSKFLQMTVQPSIVGSKIKRTKFFFGYRYMWTRCQLAEPGSYIGAGVRKDVTPPPKWTKKIQNDFVDHNIVEKDFLNSIAINVYHDGKEGLAQHFDDAVRFRQPIFTLRLFSDARLSFGSQFYGFCNGAFIIPLPRGCICVMGENSYAANGVKHCVRPCDMTGKSAAVILRQMHSQVVNEAQKYDELIDFPAWVSCLSESEESVTFAEQKRRESEYCLNLPK